ncbi:type I-E CRISPR-associated protein Cse1/CasA [Saccharomonospora azurea]|uniref:type I-E CRISPR-associated protein Cse1/CasA n=1 Tax=Saccharomonospora azurea TaxID=40988 RepID=UPI0033187C13
MSCDLRVEPVFPVRTLDGDTRRVGLRELLVDAHTFAGLDVTIPPAEAVMLRVLYVVAARVSGLDQSTPETFAEDRDHALAWGQFKPEVVDAYLDHPDHEWDLFHPRRPWMQDPRLVEQSTRKSINVLDATRPGDNSPIWWKHTHTDYAPPMPPHEAFQWLLAQHGYGNAGGGGVREVTSGATTVRDQYMSAGPLRSTVSYYPIGRTLHETLLVGIPAPTESNEQPDVAPWETAELHDPLDTPPAPTWPAGLLVGRSRHGLLLTEADDGDVDGCYFTWGWKEPHPPVQDPYCVYDELKRPGSDPVWVERRANADRAAWRDVDALLADHPTQQRPRILAEAATLPAFVRDHLTVRVIGWDQDRQTRDRAWYIADTPAVLRYAEEHDPQRAAYAHKLARTADSVGRLMTYALSTSYRAEGLGDKCPWVQPATLAYWSEAERVFWHQINATNLLGDGSEDDPYVPTPGDGTTPERLFTRIALDVIDKVTRSLSRHPAAAKAAANAAAQTTNTVRKQQKKEAASA